MTYAKYGVEVVVLVCFVCLSRSQPTNDRPRTIWRATNGCETWSIVDDGGQIPRLSGIYCSNSVSWSLSSAPFDYQHNVYLANAVRTNDGRTQAIEIRYLKNLEDGSVEADIGGKRVCFFQ